MRFEKQRAISEQRSAVRAPRPSAFRLPLAGMTLVELLVVIVIVTTLVTTAIPIMAPGGDRRALREASRNLNAYLAGAQARAIQTGRPFGVALRPLSADTGRGTDNAVCTTVEYVEVPAPFAGFGEESRCRIGVLEGPNVRQLALEFVRYGSDTPRGNDALPDGFDRDLVPDSYLRPYDEIEVYGETFILLPYVVGNPFEQSISQAFFDVLLPYNAFTLGDTNGLLGYFPGTTANPQGRRQVYSCVPRGTRARGSEDIPFASFEAAGNNETAPTSIEWRGRLTHDNDGLPVGSPEALSSSDDAGFEVFWSAPAPYKINRQPVPATGEALELPTGAAIDLQASVRIDGNQLDSFYNLNAVQYDATSDTFEAFDTPTMILFSPDGGIEKFYRTTNTNSNGQSSTRVTGSIALCIGRRELIPAQPTDRAVTTLGKPASYNEPIDLQRDVLDAGLEPGSTEALELTDLYNWLNLDSRWVVIGAQSGSVVTVENSQADVTINTTGGPRPDIDSDVPLGEIRVAEQLRAAIENAPRRSTAGGR